MNTVWEPAVEVESANGVREVKIKTRLLTQRKIFITGEINSESANDFIAELLQMEVEPQKPVTIYINSPGGEVNAGLLIYDAIQGSKLNISIVCMGMCASMAAVLLCGGRNGQRYILPHSKVMIHEPLIAGGASGSATSIKHISDSILETRDIISEILSKHTGKDVVTINEAISFDNYMDAKKAIEFGICDEIITSIA